MFVEGDGDLVPTSAQFDVAHLNCSAVVTIVINNKLVVNIEAAAVIAFRLEGVCAWASDPDLAAEAHHVVIVQ